MAEQLKIQAVDNISVGEKVLKSSEMIKRCKRRKELVQATANSISRRFADVSDFETVADLQIAVKAAQIEVDSINVLLEPLS